MSSVNHILRGQECIFYTEAISASKKNCYACTDVKKLYMVSGGMPMRVCGGSITCPTAMRPSSTPNVEIERRTKVRRETTSEDTTKHTTVTVKVVSCLPFMSN